MFSFAPRLTAAFALGGQAAPGGQGLAASVLSGGILHKTYRILIQTKHFCGTISQ
jgi:hypothetical protein